MNGAERVSGWLPVEVRTVTPASQFLTNNLLRTFLLTYLLTKEKEKCFFPNSYHLKDNHSHTIQFASVYRGFMQLCLYTTKCRLARVRCAQNDHVISGELLTSKRASHGRKCEILGSLLNHKGPCRLDQNYLLICDCFPMK